MRTTTLIWLSVAVLLSSSSAWAGAFNYYNVGCISSGGLYEEFINRDLERVPDKNFNVYVHPFGEIRLTTTTTSICNGTRRTTTDTRVLPSSPFELCSTCGGNPEAGYQLRIYSKDQDPTMGQKFDKPILVTQGFDANYKLPDQFGFAKFEDMLSKVVDEDTGQEFPELSLLRKLYNEGYDIALLLWKNPLINIPTNAKVTLQALQWLENYTDIRAGTEPVIIGPSLGGLVTRYALQLAGRDILTYPIRARLFIAFDSPNRGAEIPMSLQVLVSYFRDHDSDQRQLFMNLTSTAARQLLLSSVREQDTGDVRQVITNYEDPATYHGSFMKDINDPFFRREIKNLYHPVADHYEPIYTAAIINGSGTGRDLGYPQGHEYVHNSTFKLDLSLSTATTPGIVIHKDVCDADINPHGVPFSEDKDHLVYLFEEPSFMESAPGGLRATYQQITKVLLDRFPADVDRGFVDHTFIPSLSGAGLLDRDINNEQSWFTAIGTSGQECNPGTNPVFCPTSMFDEFRAPMKNQEHVAVTRENKTWFLDLIHTYGPQAAALDFETPSLGASNRALINPYVEGVTGITFSAEPDPEGVVATAVGLVKNDGNATSACVPPPDANQKLGTGVDASSIGLSGFGIKATFPSLLPAGVRVSVELQRRVGEGIQPARLRLFDDSNKEVASVTAANGPRLGVCPGLIGTDRTKITLTAVSTQPVAYAIMDSVGTSNVVFVIDNLSCAPSCVGGE